MSGERILVVDDEAGMLHGVERILRSNYTVATCSDPIQAIELANEVDPELAILDVRMPELDGFGLMRKLRETRPAIDVIFMTGAVHEIDTQLTRAIRERAFYFIQKPFDRDVLLALVDRCLELRRLSRENAEHVARLEGELTAARNFQRGLLPGEAASFGGVQLSARSRPCDDLGGDFYDWIEVSPGRVALLVGDVSGHGVSAAMLTGIVKSAFHDAHTEDFAPAAVTGRVARALRPFDAGKFVTLFCARVDSDGALEYVNAGHPPPLIWGGEHDPRELKLTGPLVSPVLADLEWGTASCELNAGERLLVYTDGLTEARRGEDELWGEERLHAAATESAVDGEALLDEIFTRVNEFTGGAPPDAAQLV